MDLQHTYDTYGNHGQFSQHTDYVMVGGAFVRCDQVPGAVVRDESAPSRKNRHDNLQVQADVLPETWGYTLTASASSSRATSSREYWRAAADGGRHLVSHQRVKRVEALVEVTVDVLPDLEVVVKCVPRGVRTNGYAGRCCQCGRPVEAEHGELLKAGGKWVTRCTDCFLAAQEGGGA